MNMEQLTPIEIYETYWMILKPKINDIGKARISWTSGPSRIIDSLISMPRKQRKQVPKIFPKFKSLDHNA